MIHYEKLNELLYAMSLALLTLSVTRLIEETTPLSNAG